MPTTKVQCPTCDGQGTVPLSTELQNVLDEFTKPDSAFTVTQMKERLEKRHKETVLHTALNNRMESLRAYGLLERQKEGRMWLYSRKTA